MKSDEPLFSHRVDLANLPREGSEEYFEVPPAACAVIAKVFNVDAIEDFTARLRLSRASKDEFVAEGSFKATVVQTCIVTLKPVRTRIDQDVSRRYRVLPRNVAKLKVPIIDVAVDDEETETVESPRVDLAAAVLEELVLAIDPYPRAEGAEFEGGGEAAPEEDSPFAVLKALKSPPEKP